MRSNYIFVLLVVMLSSCSSYSSKFPCPEARGVICTPLRVVDEMISTGRIEEVDIDHKKQKQCGKICGH